MQRSYPQPLKRRLFFYISWRGLTRQSDGFIITPGHHGWLFTLPQTRSETRNLPLTTQPLPNWWTQKRHFSGVLSFTGGSCLLHSCATICMTLVSYTMSLHIDFMGLCRSNSHDSLSWFNMQILVNKVVSIAILSSWFTLVLIEVSQSWFKSTYKKSLLKNWPRKERKRILLLNEYWI